MSELNHAKAKDRIAKLRSLIEDYRYHYHILNESIMSEEAADSLKHELTQLETLYPDLITADSPSQRVSGTVQPGFSSVQHSSRMLSLNDVFDSGEVNAWIQRIKKLLPPGTDLEYFADIKMDGLACALVYNDGILVRGITRGDGLVGEDVTMNVRTIESVPLRLRQNQSGNILLQGRTEVRGEIVMYKDDFEKLNQLRTKQGKPLFANPRNTAAGTIRQLDPTLVAQRPLHFRAYDLLRDNEIDIPTYAFAYEKMKELGFLVNSDAKVIKQPEEIFEFASHWEEERLKLPFNTDGLVIKVNDKQIFRRLGIVGKAPRGAIAFKYAAEQATTKVKDIFVSIGRTGAATPVALLSPVQIAGSTVQMATLHNEGEVKRKDIRIGDTVVVHKAGDIIPEIVEPLVKLRDGSEKNFQMPELCPDCHTRLIKINQADAVWRCPNNACPSRAWKAIEHYASKEAMDIEGLGEKNVVALLEAKLVNDSADLYSLTENDVVQLERFAKVSAAKLVNGIQSKKQPQLNRFIYGLGIRHVGVQTAIDIANHFREFGKLVDADIDELSGIDGIGEVVAEAVVEWFSEPDHKKLLEKFKSAGVVPLAVKSLGGKLSEKKFVVTGTLESMGREEAAEKIRKLGGTFQNSVAKDTDYLVAGKNVGASKLKKANSLGTKIITEQEFIALL